MFDHIHHLEQKLQERQRKSEQQQGENKLMHVDRSAEWRASQLIHLTLFDK